MKKTTFAIIFLSIFAILMTMELSVTTHANDSQITLENITEICQDNLQFNLGFTAATARNSNDCHENGDCEATCGSGFTACSYMDCGSGTQLCHKGMSDDDQ